MNDDYIFIRNSVYQSIYLRIPLPLLELGYSFNEAAYLMKMFDLHADLVDKEKIEPESPLYLQRERIEAELKFSSDSQRFYTKKLVDNGLITVYRKGVPPKNYYQFNWKKMRELFDYIITSSKNIKNSHKNPKSLNHRDSNPDEKGIQTPMKKGTKYNNTSKENTSYSLHFLPSEEKESNTSAFEDESTSDHSPSPLSLRRRIDTTPVQQLLYIYRPTREVLDIVRYWNSSPGLARTKTPEGKELPTATFKKTCERLQSLLQGNFFTSIGKTDQDRKFTKTEIITVIDRFKIAATNLNYQPANKDKIKKITLYVFIHNEYSSFPSYFLQFLDQEPVLLRHTAKPTEDPNPMYSQWLREAYEKWVLMGEKPKWDQTKLNQFIEGGIKMQKAFYKLAPRVLSTTDQPYIVELAVKALIKRFSASGVTPGHLASDWTYKVLLPQELTELGIIQKVVYPEWKEG